MSRTNAAQATQPAGPESSYGEWLENISSNFDPKEQYLIPVLQYVQQQAGYLPPAAMRATARFLHVPESKVYGVASFYAQFYFEPRGLNTLTICRGTACHVRGSARLLSEMEHLLQIKPGGSTEDLIFSLETVACFGACALAPVVVINDQVHRQQTPASLKKTVQDIRTRTRRSSAQAEKNRRKPAKRRSKKKAGKKAKKPRRSK